MSRSKGCSTSKKLLDFTCLQGGFKAVHIRPHPDDTGYPIGRDGQLLLPPGFAGLRLFAGSGGLRGRRLRRRGTSPWRGSCQCNDGFRWWREHPVMVGRLAFETLKGKVEVANLDRLAFCHAVTPHAAP